MLPYRSPRLQPLLLRRLIPRLQPLLLRLLLRLQPLLLRRLLLRLPRFPLRIRVMPVNTPCPRSPCLPRINGAWTAFPWVQLAG